MPDISAERGDIYQVDRVAVVSHTSDPKPSRPMVCVAELPFDPIGWKAMPRLTSGGNATDLRSEADPSIGLSKPGWWTYRFLHTVSKERTGKTDCRFKGALQDPERSRVLAFYMSR